MIELEKTYLAKNLPEGLENCQSKEIIDIYLPKSAVHPVLRIRKNGDKYEMTKKQPLDQQDRSCQKEQTINLTKAEFDELAKIDGKRVHKIRYYYEVSGNIAEIGVFQKDLKGLVVIDFEFKTESEKDSFKPPDFCLADVTQEDFIAGGMICGKTYKNLESKLKKLNYKKLFLS